MTPWKGEKVPSHGTSRIAYLKVAGCSVIIDASGFAMRHFMAIKLEHQRAVVNFVQVTMDS